MDEKVLVTYASKYGATAEIAEKTGETLRQAGLHNRYFACKEGSRPNRIQPLSWAAQFTLGNGARMRSSSSKKIKRYWLTASLALFERAHAGDGDPVELLQGWRFPSSLQPVVDSIQPRDIAVFHGNVDIYGKGQFHREVDDHQCQSPPSATFVIGMPLLPGLLRSQKLCKENKDDVPIKFAR